ncbi:uncharacterized protein PAC_04321 [Phialocephala subalpina]|uniref:Uncharacterized protein n=1 Tax=Phialocephala subalpina TaxID=576137 RepID=A0A1L7WNU5_9HELO|nr:uncharacterized protein PAC_04321 [Phialocephala subalpina]
MTTFTQTGCFEHPQRLDLTDDCMTCSVIVSFDMDTTTVGTSDNPNSVYPEIDTNLLAGPATFVTSPKKLNNFQAPVAKMSNWVPKPIVLNTFCISRDFHPGQSNLKEANYPERFSLGDKDYPERFAFTPEELRINQPYRKVLPAKRRSKKTEPASPLPSAPPASKRETAEEQLKQHISKEDLEALVKQFVADRLQFAKASASNESTENKEIVAKTPEPQPEVSEPEEDTIVVDVPSDSESEDEDPVQVRRSPNRLQAAKDELLAALLADNDQKSKKGKKAPPKRTVAQATKDLTSDEKGPPAKKTWGTKRAIPTGSSEYELRNSKRLRSASTESTDNEPSARKIHSLKRSKQSECSDEETPRASRSQTKKTKTVAQFTRSLRSRGRSSRVSSAQ